MYEMRRRKLETTLLPTQVIFNLPHQIGLGFVPLSAGSPTLRSNQLSYLPHPHVRGRRQMHYVFNNMHIECQTLHKLLVRLSWLHLFLTCIRPRQLATQCPTLCRHSGPRLLFTLVPDFHYSRLPFLYGEVALLPPWQPGHLLRIQLTIVVMERMPLLRSRSWALCICTYVHMCIYKYKYMYIYSKTFLYQLTVEPTLNGLFREVVDLGSQNI